MHSSSESANIINLRITYRTSRVPLLEAVAFKDKKNALVEIKSIPKVDECVLLQTCNRIELFIVSENKEDIVKTVKENLAGRAGSMVEEALSKIEVSMDQDALRHLLSLASGLESMVVGEDQVLNQVWGAYLEADSAKAAGPILRHVFNRAVNIGKRVRTETGINKGAVSVGSVAVELAESILGGLDDKKVLIMGAGEMGTLAAKTLSRRCLNPIFIANRTYDHAVKLAEELSGKAVRFDKLEETLVDADVVICSTAAPHYLLTKELVSKIISQRQNKNNLIIIDISNPRNVEKTIEEIEQVQLYNIDDLQQMAERNKEERQKKVEMASKILEEELVLLSRDLKALSVRNIISSLFSHAEEIRQRELMKALSMMGNVDEKEKKIIGDLTSILLKQTFVPIIENLRLAAINNDVDLIEAAVKLLGMDGSQLA